MLMKKKDANDWFKIKKKMKGSWMSLEYNEGKEDINSTNDLFKKHWNILVFLLPTI